MDMLSFLYGALSVVGAGFLACAVYGAVIGYKTRKALMEVINDSIKINNEIRNKIQEESNSIRSEMDNKESGLRMEIRRTVDSRLDKMDSRLSKVESNMNNN